MNKIESLTRTHLAVRLSRSVVAFVIALFVLHLASLPAFAQGSPPLRVVMLPALIRDAIAQMLPIAIESPGGASDLVPQNLSIVGLVYCGADPGGAGEAIGVISPGTPSSIAPMTLGTSECNGSLASLAPRLLASGDSSDWLNVVRIRAAWTPWRLTLTVIDAAGAARSGYTAPNLRGLGQIKAYTTSGLRILTGAGRNVAFDLAIGFPGQAISVVAIPSGQISNPAPFLTDAAVANEIAGAPHMSNVIADANYTFINQVMRLYASTFNIPIPIQGTTQTLTAQNLRVSGGENLLTVAGQLAYQSAAYDASVRAQGDDLTVSQITLDSPAENCNQDDMMARLQCQGRGLAMSGSSSALAGALTNYYAGQPFHVSSRTHPLTFTFGGADYQVTFDALKSSSHGGSLIEAGRATLLRAP
jgi:hypothetical protein